MKFNARLTRRHSLLLVPLYIALNLVPSATHSSLSSIRSLWTPPPPPPQDIPPMQNLAEAVPQSLNAIQHGESPPTSYSQDTLSWPNNEDRLGLFASIFDFIPTCFNIAQSIIASPMSRPTPSELRDLPSFDLIFTAISPAIISSVSHVLSMFVTPTLSPLLSEPFQPTVVVAMLLVILQRLAKGKGRLRRLSLSLSLWAEYLFICELKLISLALSAYTYLLLLLGPTPLQLARLHRKISEKEAEIEKSAAEIQRHDQRLQEIGIDIADNKEELALEMRMPSTPPVQKRRRDLARRIAQLKEEQDDVAVAKAVETDRIKRLKHELELMRPLTGWMGALLRNRELENSNGTLSSKLFKMRNNAENQEFVHSVREMHFKDVQRESEELRHKAARYKESSDYFQDKLEAARVSLAENAATIEDQDRTIEELEEEKSRLSARVLQLEEELRLATSEEDGED